MSIPELLILAVSLSADAFADVEGEAVEGRRGVGRVRETVDRDGSGPHVVPDQVLSLYIVGDLEIAVDFGDIHVRFLSGNNSKQV